MIRPYNDSDYTQVKEILKQGFLTYVSTEFEISPKDVNDFDFTPKMKFLSKDNVTTWVLDTGNEVVGFVSIRPCQEGMELLKIYVVKGSQKKGYGRVLFEHVLKATPKNHKIIVCAVGHSKIACSFYEKIDFVLESYIPKNYQLLPGKMVDSAKYVFTK